MSQPTLRYRDKQIISELGDTHFIKEAYWESAAAPVASATELAKTNDSLDPNMKMDMVRKKKRRGLTIQKDAEAPLTNLLASIGLNIPS